MASASFLFSATQAAWRERFGTAASLQRYADRQLKRLLDHSRARVPFQQHRLQRMKRWEDIEPTTKNEMMAHLGDTLAEGTVTAAEVQQMAADVGPGSKWIRDEYLVAKTGGTNGVRGVFVIDRPSWNVQRAALFSRSNRGLNPLRRVAGLLRGDKFRMASLTTDCVFCVSSQSTRSAKLQGSRLAEMLELSILSPIEETIERLNQFQPHYLFVYPSYLCTMARARLAGRDVRFDPVTFTVGCEVLSEPDRQLINEAFPRTRLINQYGATECISLAIGCPAGQLHLNSDCVLMELVDAQYHPVPAGEFSERLLITNLTNRVQPIIRYVLDDSVRRLDEPCPCRSPMPVIEIRGRSDDVFHLVDSNNQIRKCPPLAFQTGLTSCPYVDFLQLVHVRQNELELRITLASSVNVKSASDAVRSDLLKVLATQDLDRSVDIRIVIVNSIERTLGAAKLKIVISEVPQSAATDYQRSHAG